MNKVVGFHIAKLLKEKGFRLLPDFKSSYPTIAEVVMWLYENHKFWIVAFPIEDDFWAFDVFDSKSECIKSGMEFNSLTEAYEAAIEYTLNKLIK